MTFAEALAELVKSGAVTMGRNFRTRLTENPHHLNGVFVVTVGQPQPHFETTLHNGKKSYLRRDHRDPFSLVFGDTP